MNKLTQLQKNLDEFNEALLTTDIKGRVQLSEIYRIEIYVPFTELLKELGLNELPITLDKEEDESKPA